MLFFQQRHDGLHLIFRQAGQHQADAGVGAGGGIGRQMRRPWPALHPGIERGGIGIGAGLQGFKPTEAIGPQQRIDIVFDRQHRRRVDGFANEQPFG